MLSYFLFYMWANGGLWSFLKLTILKWYNYQSPNLTPDSEYTPLTTMLYLFLIHWVFGVIIQTPLDQCWTMRFHKSSFHSSDTKVGRASSCRLHDHTTQFAQMSSWNSGVFPAPMWMCSSTLHWSFWQFSDFCASSHS